MQQTSSFSESKSVNNHIRNPTRSTNLCLEGQQH